MPYSLASLDLPRRGPPLSLLFPPLCPDQQAHKHAYSLQTLAEYLLRAQPLLRPNGVVPAFQRVACNTLARGLELHPESMGHLRT